MHMVPIVRDNSAGFQAQLVKGPQETRDRKQFASTALIYAKTRLSTVMGMEVAVVFRKYSTPTVPNIKNSFVL